jgi:hypothetical protein
VSRLGVLSLAAAPRRPRAGEEREDLRREDAILAVLRAKGHFVLAAGGPFHEEDAVAFDDGDLDRLTGTFHLHAVDLLLLVDFRDDTELRGQALARLRAILPELPILILGPRGPEEGADEDRFRAEESPIRHLRRDLELEPPSILDSAFFEVLGGLLRRGNSP